MSRHRHLFWKGLFSLLLALIWVVASTLPAFADVAPPPRTQASGIVPEGEQTQVRMMYENVFMDIGLDGVAKVDANFVMLNLGDKEETMDVYFPLYSGVDFETKRGCEEPISKDWIKDLTVWVWDKPQSVRTDWVTTPNRYYGLAPDEPEKIRVPCWGVFAVTFPPGLNVPIEVKYTRSFYWFYTVKPAYTYILETGAGWKGTIGHADITARFPYDIIQDHNLRSCGPEPCTLNGRDIQWQFMDFEPTQDDNIQIFTVQPATWWKVLTEVNNLKLNPKDGAAWKRLALAYNAAIFMNYAGRGYTDPSGWQYRTLVETFQKAISFNPGDSDLHYQLAQVICTKAAWNFSPDSPYAEGVAVWVECSQQIKQALDINPKNQEALGLARAYAYWPGPFWKAKVIEMKGDQPDFLVLTPTATPIPTIPATITLTPMPTLLPTPSVLPSQTPSLTATLPANTPTPLPLIPEAGAGGVWAWMLIPLAALVAFGIVRRRKS